MKFRQILGLVIGLICILTCNAANLFHKKISLDLDNVSMQQAVRILADFMHMNLVISPAVLGSTALHLQEVPAKAALDALLATHQLTLWQEDQVWFVGTASEFSHYSEAVLHLRSSKEALASLALRVWQIHYAKASDILELLQSTKNSILSKRGHAAVDRRTNMLYVQDIQEHLQDVNMLIKRLDIPLRQVLIEAHLVSVDCDYEQELGIQYTLENSGFTVAKLADTIQLNVQLAALERQGHGEIISSPSLFTANQQTASIESGEEIPYQEVSSSGATGITFKKAVLSLKVTPQIMPNQQVLLQLQVNQDKPSKRIVLGVPAITTRQISTNILVKNGQTVVLGGIYETNRERDFEGIPFLDKIPLVGRLFRQQNVTNTKRELLIFVTPKIIM
jgi:type IV pilus assembly protein PilQ